MKNQNLVSELEKGNGKSRPTKGGHGVPAKELSELRCEVSVVVATRDRACQLERMLASVGRQTLGRGEVTVIVVENGCRDNTRELLERKSNELNLLALSESVASKAKALNRALDHVGGDLVVFTDDDTTAPPKWLEAYQSAARKFPSASVFCGPVIPECPTEVPQWLRYRTLFSPLLFAKFDLPLSEGPIPEPLGETSLPFGGNFAARTEAVKTMRFNHGLGPSDENGPLYDEDTEFLGRLHSGFGQFIYVPEAAVVHHIEAQGVEWAKLFEKAFHFGRTMAIRNGVPVNLPSSKIQPDDQDAQAIERFERGCALNFYFGQLHEFRLRGQKQFDTILKKVLKPLDVYGNRALLSQSARRSSNRPKLSRPRDTARFTSASIR